MFDWKLEREVTPHYQRQFLAPEYTRYDEGSVTSFVHLQRWVKGEAREDLTIEAELSISDGRGSVNFNFNYNSDEEADINLAVITRLMEQVTAFRQGYADGLAAVRGQSVSANADSSVTLTVDASKDDAS